MANNRGAEECRMAEPYYERIRENLVSFAAANNLEYIPWYNGFPEFTIRWRVSSGADIRRIITVRINPYFKYIKASGEEVYVGVFARADKEYSTIRRSRSFYVAKGTLPQDAERLPSILMVALSLLSAVDEGDLLSEDIWLKERETLRPIFLWR